ncbi:MAG TPA: hypothetical protein EYP59_16030, partial [Thiotrichaceae bacterium]|nr:hypothetical protein [Thiotrichaceae bacterium]
MKLQNLVNPELCLKVDNNAVKLSESQVESDTLREVTIRELPNNVFAFSADKWVKISTDNWKKSRNQFLNSENDKINKNCDAVIIQYDDNQLNIACCELKSKNPTPIQYETQLINTKLLIDYLVALFNTFYEEEKVEIKNVWYVLFYQNRAIRDKKSIRGEPQPV